MQWIFESITSDIDNQRLYAATYIFLSNVRQKKYFLAFSFLCACDLGAV